MRWTGYEADLRKLGGNYKMENNFQVDLETSIIEGCWLRSLGAKSKLLFVRHDLLRIREVLGSVLAQRQAVPTPQSSAIFFFFFF
jgi:hypothetical protein